MEILFTTTSEKQEDGTWKEIRTPLSAEEQALREKEEKEWKEYVDTVVIPNRYKSNRVEGVFALNAEGEAIDHNEKVIKYPSIGDQLDMLWHAIDTNTLDKTSDFYNNLKAVKDKYTKE